MQAGVLATSNSQLARHLEKQKDLTFLKAKLSDWDCWLWAEGKIQEGVTAATEGLCLVGCGASRFVPGDLYKSSFVVHFEFN